MPAAQWARLRRRILDRDEFRCTRCGRYGILEVHHVDHDPTNNDPGNLVTRCKGCHIDEHRRPLTATEARWRANCGDGKSKAGNEMEVGEIFFTP